MVHQLRKSYSLTDLNSDEPDYGADLRAITNDTGMEHNELKCGKKSILAGQCTVCLKGYDQRFLKYFRVEGLRKGPGVKN